MSGKDLLAVLGMTIPTLLLVIAMAFTVIQAAGPVEKVDQGHGAAMRDKPQIATQKQMRDPWRKPIYAKSSMAPDVGTCDSRTGDQSTPCVYW